MAAQRLTELLDRYHDKLNQHTTEIKDVRHDIEVLQQSVAALEAKAAEEDESSGLLAGLREWAWSLKDLL